MNSTINPYARVYCENPIGAIENFLRVVNENGIIYLAIPNKDYTFDRTRPTTSLAHLWSDYDGEPEWPRERHFQEFVRGMKSAGSGGASEEDIRGEAAGLLARDYSIHYHVWDLDSWIAFILSLRQRFPFRTECILRHSEEIITVLSKTAQPVPGK